MCLVWNLDSKYRELLGHYCCRMENSVLGNALEGVPDEDEEDQGKIPNGSTVESTENVDGMKP